MKPLISGGSDFRPASSRRDITSNICCESNKNLDDMSYCRKTMEGSEDFQMNFAKLHLLQEQTSWFPVLTVNSLILHYVSSQRTNFHCAKTECY